MRNLTVLLLALIWLPLHAQMDWDAMQENQPKYVKGQLYFKIKPSSGIELPTYKSKHDTPDKYEAHPQIQDLLNQYGVTKIFKPFVTQHPDIQNIYKLKFTDLQNSPALIKELQSLEHVNYAEKVQIYRQFYTPDDIHAKQQWYMDTIKAQAAWDTTRGDTNITVAIVDDAIDINHPDLAPAIWTNTGEIPGDGNDNDGNGYVDDVNGWDAADMDPDPTPPDSHNLYGNGIPLYAHGTHTSGIAAGATDNNMGIASLGFNCRIMPIKGTSSSSFLPLGIEAPAEAIDYAINNEADIISMSFGGGEDSTVTNMLEVAHQDSIFLVAAAGNNGATDTLYPAGLDYVLAVGSTSRGDIVSDFSQYGTWIDIMAPGSEIYSTYFFEGAQTYDTLSGTSMACPMVAGLASLIQARDTSYTPSQIKHCIQEGAENITYLNPAYEDSIGAGRINAFRSLRCMEATPEPVSAFHKLPQNGQACEGDQIMFFEDAFEGDSLFWTFQGGTPSTDSSQKPVVTYNSAGSFNVTLVAKNQHGSDTIQGTINIYAYPVSSFNMNMDTLNIAMNDTLKLTNLSSNATGYDWYFGDGNTSTDTDPSHFYNSSGDYGITLISINNGGCSDTITDTVHVINSTGITEQNTSTENIKIYPNPTGDQLHMQLEELQVQSVEVLNLLGARQLLFKDLQSGVASFDVSALARGTYLLKITGDSGEVHSVKFTTVE